MVGRKFQIHQRLIPINKYQLVRDALIIQIGNSIETVPVSMHGRDRVSKVFNITSILGKATNSIGEAYV